MNETQRTIRGHRGHYLLLGNMGMSMLGGFDGLMGDRLPQATW